MKKLIPTLLLAIFLAGCGSTYAGHEKHYSFSSKDLALGQATLADVVDAMGQPHSPVYTRSGSDLRKLAGEFSHTPIPSTWIDNEDVFKVVKYHQSTKMLIVRGPLKIENYRLYLFDQEHVLQRVLSFEPGRVEG